MTPGPRLYRDLLYTYLWLYRRRVVLLAAVLLFDIALQLINPQILRFFIETAQRGGASSTLASAAVLFIVVVLAAQAVSSLAVYMSQDVGWTATNALRVDLTLHCLRLDAGFHHQHSPGALLERIDGDVSLLANFFSAFVVRVLGNSLLLIGIVILIGREDVRVGLALLLYTGAALVLLGRAQRWPVASFMAWRQATAALSGFWEEHLTTIEDIRSSGAERYVLQKQDVMMGEVMRHGRKNLILTRAFQSVLEVLTAIGSALAFTLGAYLLSAGAMSLGTVFLVFSYTSLLSWRLGAIAEQLNDFQSASAAVTRIADLWKVKPAIVDGPGVPLSTGPLAVEFRDVSFGYGESPVLHNITFAVERGRILGVVGRTGSGKTTLTRLLLRFCDPHDGVILINDTDLKTLRLAEVRTRIGVVTQEVQLFTASLRDNLTLFAHDSNDAHLIATIHDLGLDEWYAALPGGLDTPISPAQLSAGELQLLALARVFLKNPDLVIFDEASSRLDPCTERLIESALDRLFAGRTGIIVAHRLTTLERADDILVLDDGHVVEHGPRDDLAANPYSHYGRLLHAGGYAVREVSL